MIYFHRHFWEMVVKKVLAANRFLLYKSMLETFITFKVGPPLPVESFSCNQYSDQISFSLLHKSMLKTNFSSWSFFASEIFQLPIELESMIEMFVSS